MRILLWLSNNLRLHDNPSLVAAIEKAKESDQAVTIFPIYIVDTTDPWPMQGARRWWLHHSLSSLTKSLQPFNAKISFFQGDPKTIIEDLLKTKTQAVYLSANYCQHDEEQQKAVKKVCDKHEVECRKFAGTLLFDPYNNTNKEGNIYKVFTPYYKHSKSTYPPKDPKAAPNNKDIQAYLAASSIESSLSLSALNLLPSLSWADEFSHHWEPGEKGAHKRLNDAVADIIASYKSTRDIPSLDGTSRLSPHLHFGEISPREVWQTVSRNIEPEDCEPYLRQLVWRDFSYSLIANWKDFPEKSFKEKFEKFPWSKNTKNLTAWQQGKTGYPIVDAGMRQLWHTGWMHNRVRMIVASFLTKHLRIHWHEGAKWFWDTLLDADLANNSAGWQWVAGSGADAAPYFRVFNPTLQSEKFDKKGEYLRTWIPELKNLSDKYIHAPWDAPKDLLKEAGITLGKDYPTPIVEHKEARQAALEAYGKIKG